MLDSFLGFVGEYLCVSLSTDIYIYIYIVNVGYRIIKVGFTDHKLYFAECIYTSFRENVSINNNLKKHQSVHHFAQYPYWHLTNRVIVAADPPATFSAK